RPAPINCSPSVNRRELATLVLLRFHPPHGCRRRAVKRRPMVTTQVSIRTALSLRRDAHAAMAVNCVLRTEYSAAYRSLRDSLHSVPARSSSYETLRTEYDVLRMRCLTLLCDQRQRRRSSEGPM